ncbi:MAG TPA: hypothetical protein VIW47_13595, partial [Nitrospiraceae bacterium]
MPEIYPLTWMEAVVRSADYAELGIIRGNTRSLSRCVQKVPTAPTNDRAAVTDTIRATLRLRAGMP